MIAIVGILSGFVLVSLNSATDSANDARRKSDLSQIVKALLVYNTSNPTYPIETCSIGSTCSATVNNALGQASGITGPNNTYYTYSSIDGTSFTVSAIMSDTDIYSYDSETGYSESPAEPGLPGYAKRQPITINSASALTDYQVKLTITYDSDMQPDFDDLRFTSADGTTELSYWLESKTDSTTAIVWVKVPSLSSGDNTLYMYYANASAITASNGNNTFIFFDDFLGSEIDIDKWSFTRESLGNGNYTVNSGVLTWTKVPFGIIATHNSLSSATLTMRTYLSNYTTNGCGIAWNDVFDIWKDTVEDRVAMYDTVASTLRDVANFPTSYSIVDLKRSNNSLSIYINGAKQGSSYTNSNILSTIKLGHMGYSGSIVTVANYRIDWIAVRAATGTDLTPSFGAEQSI